MIGNIKNNLDCFTWFRDIRLASMPTHGARIFNSSSQAAILAMYQNGESCEKLERFIDVLGSGFASCENERIIILLRDWLNRAKGDGGARSAINNMIYCTVQSAYKKFADGKGNAKMIKSAHKPICIWYHEFRKSGNE